VTIKDLDHLVFATSNASDAALAWRDAFGLEAEAAYTPEDAHLHLTRILLEQGAFLELAQASAVDHRLARFVEERGEGMFSISVAVDDIDATVADLRARGVDVSDPEPGAWPGTRLARIPRASGHGAAVQLLERRQDQSGRTA
jgi:methylmalonyl-CoA/ethylmalonyl-CoA epimerase